MRKIMLVVLVVFAALAVMPHDAEAKKGARLGGGKSVGKQQETTSIRKETASPANTSKPIEYNINLPIRSSTGSSSSATSQSRQSSSVETAGPLATRVAAPAVANAATIPVSSPSFLGSSLSITVILILMAIVIFFIFKMFRSL